MFVGNDNVLLPTNSNFGTGSGSSDVGHGPGQHGPGQVFYYSVSE